MSDGHGREFKMLPPPHLLCVQVNKPQVVSNDPFKRPKVQGFLQASDCSNVTLLPEEAHSNVVP